METRLAEPVRRGGQYLNFRVARRDFAIQASLVRGILSVRDLEPVAPSPSLSQFFGEWTCGFVTLRGSDVPVIDLRGRLNLPHATHGRHPCIVVVEVGTSSGPRLAGFIADRVSEIVYVPEGQFADGELRSGASLRRLLDPDLLLAPAVSLNP